MAPLAPRAPQPSQMSLGPLNSSAQWKQRRPLAMEQGVNGSFGCCHCRGASQGDMELEAEIFDFMAKSPKPGSFPTREELVSARRMDLVEAIVDHGGWLAYGWDLDDRLSSSNRDYDNGDAGSHLDGRGADDDSSNPISIEPRSESRRERKRVLSDLQQLESELSSVLGSLGMNARKSLDELDRLSDELEFKETEAACVEEKLRSIRAKLSALEGKMTLRTAEAAKILREKQRRIDAARRALGVLSAAIVIWPGSASEVFLAGSFDGWATLVASAILVLPFEFVLIELSISEEDGEIQRPRSFLSLLEALPGAVRDQVRRRWRVEGRPGSPDRGSFRVREQSPRRPLISFGR